MHELMVRGVTKTYAQGEAAMMALAGVDLDVHRSELMLLMGPSGSGKTTLLSVMGCILRPTSGTVHVLGDDITRLAPGSSPDLKKGTPPIATTTGLKPESTPCTCGTWP